MHKNITSPAPLPSHVSGPELADLLGVSLRHLSTLEEQGIVIKPTRGVYELRASVKNYLRRPDPCDIAAQIEAEKLRKLSAEASLAEVSLRREQGRTLDAAKCKRAWEGAVINARTALLALPERLAQQLVTADSTATAKAILEREIDATLRGLAAYKSRTADDEGAPDDGEPDGTD